MPEEIKNMTEAERISAMVNQIRSIRSGHIIHIQDDLQPYRKEAYLKSLLKDLKQAANEQKTAMLAILGEMSGGKSSLLNALVGYPLLPVAEVVTSTCPVELRYSKSFRLQIFTYNEKREEKVMYTFEQGQTLDPGLLHKLKQYVLKCFAGQVLICENLAYYHSGSGANKFDALDPKDPIQLAQLMMVPLSGYIGQDDQYAGKANETLIADRAKLMREFFDVDADSHYGVRIWLDSQLLKNGLVLVDLPGLGADVQTHTGITTEYLEHADCYIMVFGRNGQVTAASDVLNNMMKFQKMQSGSKDARFLVVMNKCDGAKPDVLSQAVRQLKTKISQIGLGQVIPVSAYWSEARFVENGVPIENTMCWEAATQEVPKFIDALKAMGYPEPPQQSIPGMIRTKAQEMLSTRYTAPISYEDPFTHQTVSCSSKDFAEDVIGQYATRIRLLNELYMTKKLSARLDAGRSQLAIQAELLKMLQTCGNELMHSLLDEVNKSLLESQSRFFNNLEMKKSAILQDVADFVSGKLKPIQQDYMDQLLQANKDMNTTLQGTVSKMLKSANGVFYVDGLENSPNSIVNQQLYGSLMKYFRTFDFEPYLRSGNDQLAAELQEEQIWYTECLHSFSSCFTDMIADTQTALDEAYDAFEKNEKMAKISKKDRAIYASCFTNVKKAIILHLTKLKHQMDQEMDEDDRIGKVLSATGQKMVVFFDDLINLYHTKCTNHIRSHTRNTLFMRRPVFDVKHVSKVISEPFVSTADNKSVVDKLQDLFTDPATGHTANLQIAVNDSFGHFAATAQSKIDEFFPSITSSVENLFGAATPAIQAKMLHLCAIQKVLLDALDNISEGLSQNLEDAQALSWAAADAGELADALVQAREKALALASELQSFADAMQEECEL